MLVMFYYILKNKILVLKTNTIIACAIFLLGATSTFAQKVEVGGWIGGSHYFGDLNNNFGLKRPHLAAGAMLRYNFNPRISGKISANYGAISGYDSDSKTPLQQARNLSFESYIIDGTAQLEFNFMPYIHGSKDENFTPYVFLGGGMFAFNPQTRYNDRWVDLNPLGTEGQYLGSEYALIQPQMTYGGGVKWDLTRDWSMNVEFSCKKLFTDYLDDVSGNYSDEANLRSLRGQLAVDLADRSSYKEGKIGQPSRQRGDGLDDDMYVFLGVGLMYNFNGVRCADFR
jgi:Domain of unknown function (DUF6089)